MVQNWGGLVEPYWIGTNNFGAQSVRVSNSEPIPLAVSVNSDNVDDGTGQSSDRQLCLASDYIRSDFNSKNNTQILGMGLYIFVEKLSVKFSFGI